MSYTQLFIWVEGQDDLRLFQTIIVPTFRVSYDYVKVIAYAQLKRSKVSDYLKSMTAMAAEYIFVGDINRALCISDKKDKLVHSYSGVDIDKICVVVHEIESWYLAGLSDKSSKQLKTPKLRSTDDVTKERFEKLMPKKFDSRIDYMIEILNEFSLDIAKQKNKSFKYFIDKYFV